MGLIYADILLTNANDIEKSESHIIGEDEVRSISINMLVDSGADMLCINENIQAVLGLRFIQKRRFLLAGGISSELDVVGPVQVEFRNRITCCHAIVLPEDSGPLLGAIPMEELDVLIDPARQELIIHPDHPDHAVLRI